MTADGRTLCRPLLTPLPLPHPPLFDTRFPPLVSPGTPATRRTAPTCPSTRPQTRKGRIPTPTSAPNAPPPATWSRRYVKKVSVWHHSCFPRHRSLTRTTSNAPFRIAHLCSQDDPYTDAGSSNRTQRPGVPGSAASSFLFNPSAHASRQGSPRGSHQPFEVAEGAIVEANYRRTGTWYPGTVTRDRCVCRSSSVYPPLPPLETDKTQNHSACVIAFQVH